jgi:hypothetical protein
VSAKDAGAVDSAEQLREVLKSFDSEVVAFYMLTILESKAFEKFFVLARNSSFSFQKSVLMSLPVWVSSYLISEWSRLDKQFEGRVDLDVSVDSVVRELSLLEKDMASDATVRQDRFLSAFPLPALKEALDHGESLKPNDLILLWSVRPELPSFFDSIDLDPTDVKGSLTKTESTKLFEVLWSLRPESKAGRTVLSKVSRWAEVINGVKTLAEVDDQLAKAALKLSASEVGELRRQVAGWHSFADLSGEPLREFLRTTEAGDLCWVMGQVEASKTWDIEKLMRPMRLVMLRDALKQLQYKEWDSDQLALASQRVLTALRSPQVSAGKKLNVVAA